MKESAYNVPAPPAPVKLEQRRPARADVPGVKTSEFWLTLGAVMFPVLDGVFAWGLPTEKILAAVLAVGAYSASRAVAKRPKVIIPRVELKELPK